MSLISLKEAAEITGKSKSTISRAIKAGKLSASRDVDNNFEIDPSELERVYPIKLPVASVAKGEKEVVRGAPKRNDDAVAQLVRLQTENDLLKQQIDQERGALKDQIDDLRARLDAEAEERRALTRMLTDQRQKDDERRSQQARKLAELKAAKAAQSKRGFWAWLKGDG